MRALAWLLRAASRLACATALMSLGAWVVGRVFDDRWLWSQWVAYVPAPMLVTGVLLGLGLWGGLARARDWVLGVAPSPTGRRGRTVRWAAWTLGTLLALHQALIGWSLWRVGGSDGSKPAGSVRVLAWNPAWAAMGGFDKRIMEYRPDVVMVTQPHFTADFASLRAAMGPATYAVRTPTFALVSVYPVLRWGYTPLAIRAASARPAWLPRGVVSTDGGEGAWIELDTRASLGRTTVVWEIDLPSDPFLLRREVFREALHAMAAYRGPVQHRGADGFDHYNAPEAGDPINGFPAPDLVAGDLNTPRGAGALRLMPGDLTNAYDQAGWGPCGTYPRGLPMLHIDHVLLAPWLAARTYDVADMGAGRHRAVVVDIARK